MGLALCLSVFVSAHLEHLRSGGAGEIEAFDEVSLGIVFLHVTLDHDGFCRPLFADQQNRFPLRKKMQKSRPLTRLKRRSPVTDVLVDGANTSL